MKQPTREQLVGCIKSLRELLAYRRLSYEEKEVLRRADTLLDDEEAHRAKIARSTIKEDTMAWCGNCGKEIRHTTAGWVHTSWPNCGHAGLGPK